MAKVTLYGRVYTGEGKAKWVPVELSKNHKPVPVPGAFGYYLQFTENGKQRQVSCKTTDVQFAFAALRRKQAELLEGTPAPTVVPFVAPSSPQTAPEGGTSLADAVTKYFSNLEARGADPKTVRTYRAAVEPFVATCKKAHVEDVEKQDMLDFMGWLRKQPVPMRRHSNPERTYANKVGHVAIFLKEFGVTKLLKKSEYPKFHEKKIVAHTDEELALLYKHADEDERFLLDFFLGSMARDSEGYQSKYADLTGNTLTIRGKQHKTRTVEISARLAEAIRQRGEGSHSPYLFPNGGGKPNQHLLRDLQNLAERAGAKFHTELHKLRKTGASRRYRAGMLLMTLMQELGHNSLSTTQKYLADVKLDETKKAVAAADFVPKTGTDGD